MRATYVSQVTAIETLDIGVAAVSDPDAVHDGFNQNITGLSATSTPPVSEPVYFTAALTAGAYTIDLTALTGADGTIDGTGKKVQMLLLQNPSGNGLMTFKFGAANPYLLCADAAWRIPVCPGTGTGDTEKFGEVKMFFPNDSTNPDISGTAKTIDVIGTGTQSFRCGIWLG